MKYNYRGKNIVLDEKVVRDYEAMDGSALEKRMDYIIENEKAEHPEFDVSNVTDEDLSAVFTRQMKDELSVFYGHYE